MKPVELDWMEVMDSMKYQNFFSRSMAIVSMSAKFIIVMFADDTITNRTSASFIAELSFRSPQKLIIFTI